ncbi:GAF domain-containing sensor histidine kinase [Bacillus sp. CH126_4D]|uniref:GAF domain-containing sensor histidine kinase n=1 Tax=unclassified Bacillus (in: firmicutes) TaxID=185979 RepID=UPI00124EEACB|nr:MULTISPECIES: GAF domain-containing sensor histidine kinase [unclassified Bacillus (in: firmicutes)]KAB2459105.1 GAF domain-containing sensor histidine kinase [Bacillus sp. CH140a_4T]KAB2476258.1 GAF domain-containing sensor histidine kinase [Bacillus sp. CH126_4D]
MFRDNRTNELVILKEIAETLNTSNDTYHVLQAVLEKLLSVTGLTTGWIFLADENGKYTKLIDYQLPEALTYENKRPMCEGECWCLRGFVDGKLERAVNIIECKRINNAIEYNWGDTEGILHHATVPLKAGGEKFGVLNIASPGKTHFSEEELVLLQSVAFQIGTALKRTKLYENEKRRAYYYVKLERFIQALKTIHKFNVLPEKVVNHVGEVFQWNQVAFFIREEIELSLRASYGQKGLQEGVKEAAKKALEQDEPALLKHVNGAVIATPIHIQNHIFGVLCVSLNNGEFDVNTIDVIQALSNHVSLIIENLRLNEQRRELVRMEERNRLARDLHDSVSQKLFSLTFMTKGAEAVLKGQNEKVDQSLHEIRELSQGALKEMRTLIWQLRPAGLEKGLLPALKQYGESLGLKIREQVTGVRDLPRVVEEALWRIGQEALNNVSKHANVREATIYFKVTEKNVSLEIVDQGNGFVEKDIKEKKSLGMTTMRERVELVGGTIKIVSDKKRTSVKINVPL